MTSRKAAPLWLIAALISGTSWCLSPEKERPTKVAPIRMASETRSIDSSELATPFLLTEPLSAVAENWPLVSPYTPLFMTIKVMFTAGGMMGGNWPRPIEAESPSPDTPMYIRSRLERLAPVITDGMRPCTVLKPWEAPTKEVGALDGQPVARSFRSWCRR